ncbi:MAG: hypothetical protein Q9224_006952, partial [Gallowayella concinna]
TVLQDPRLNIIDLPGFTDAIYDNPQRMFQIMAQGNPNLPIPIFLTLRDAKRKASEHSEAIFTDQQVLVNILDRHKDTLIKRWLKKTNMQRHKVLTEAYPGIPSTHRPDFWAFRKESQAQIRAGTHYRDYWLLPHLNLEDLVKPKNLIYFLRSRARNFPGVFVNADANSVHLGYVIQAIMPSYLSGHTMLLAGQNTQQHYGRMSSWDDDVEAFDKMSTGIGLQPGEGLQVLEIQMRIMQFLRRTTGIILRDLALDDLNLPKQPGPLQDLSVLGGSEWPSLAQEVEESPYKIPNILDMDRLQTIVQSRRDEAEDHIWSLREDPSYFQDVASEWSEHRQERLLTANGKSHPILRQDTFWERVFSNVVVNAYTDLVAWTLISKEIDQLIRLQERHGAGAGPTGGLPTDVLHALAHFENLIEQLTKGVIGNWKVGMVASPALREHYVREPQDPSNTRIQ